MFNYIKETYRLFQQNRPLGGRIKQGCEPVTL